MEGVVGRSQRILAYDALRVFAILSVIGIHTLMPYRIFVPDHTPVRVFDDLLHYAVPLFVFISGVFAWGRPLSEKPGAFRDFLVRRGRVVLVPFAAWSLLYFALLVWQEGWPGLARSVALLLTGHTWYHLYFVPMLLAFYLLTPIASRLSKVSPELLLAVCYGFRIAFGPAFATLLRAWFGDLGWQFATHIATHLPHMALGAWFALRYEATPRRTRRAWPLMLIVGTAILTAASLGLHADLPLVLRRLVYPLGMAATVLGMAYGAREAEPWLEADDRASGAILAAAPLAFNVYFVHPLLLLVFFQAVPATTGSLWEQAWFAVVIYAAVVAGSFVISALIERVSRGARGSG